MSSGAGATLMAQLCGFKSTDIDDVGGECRHFQLT